MPTKQRQVNLDLKEMPTQWYNILPDLPEPLPPPQDPESGESRIKNLPKVLLGECLKQEFSNERWIDIPEELQQMYHQAGRPRPLFRAINLEKRLDMPKRRATKDSPPRPEQDNGAPPFPMGRLWPAWSVPSFGLERSTVGNMIGEV
jgi:hypothetical protein